ncbi:MAG TPA: ABC transporter ATP-binding protein [Leifsonia sp.]|jgi:putative ABC transport system ATP-binding protein
MTALLELRHVSLVYGRGEQAVHALRDVSIEVRPGELVAVMGASGSGKSSLLAIAGGLARPSEGDVLVDGLMLAEVTAKQLAALRRRSLGFVFQDYNLVPTLTAAENVGLPLELDDWSRTEVRGAVREALCTVGLADHANRFPDDLSGGQQQRVAIARAIVGPRRLVLADEPTGALDSTTGELVLRMLRDRVDAGAGGLLVTHDARHAAWADRIVFLRDGTVVDTRQAPSPESLLTAVRR